MDYCLEHTAEEVEKNLVAVGAPVMRMMKYSDMPTHPHYVARETLTVSQNSRGEDVICCNVVPKMKNNPGRIWKKAPGWGEDNTGILSELGYNKDDIAELYAERIIGGEQ